MLVLVRHGESAWNAVCRFAGWADVALTPEGRDQAVRAGRWLHQAGIEPTVVHTSLLRRAITTADLMVDACGLPAVPCVRSWRLNERHYGALQGMRQADAEARYGAERVARWRRGVDDRPPSDARGRGESYADVRLRVRPYVRTLLWPALDRGGVVLVVAHGSTVRALAELLEGTTPGEAGAVEVPTGEPRLYDDVSGLLGVARPT